jgi:hypothetical protein
MIPYVACMIVALACSRILIVLVALKRRSWTIDADGATPNETAASKSRPGWSSRSRRGWVVPACIVCALGIWVVSKARPPAEADDQFKLYDFGKIPVVFQGRAKPLDTLARNALRIISDRQTFVDNQGSRQPAIRWLLDAMVKPEAAAEHRVFRIEHPEVLQTLGLEHREGFRYAFAEFKDRVDDLSKQAKLARALDPSKLNIYQKKVVETDNKLALFDMLLESFNPLPMELTRSNKARRPAVRHQKQELLARMPLQSASRGWRALENVYAGKARGPADSNRQQHF